MRPLLVLATFFVSTPAWATCSIHNDTGESLTIASGNVSNQRVGSHTQTSIASGTITAKADSGKTAGGSCKDGDKIEVVMQNNILVIKHK